jgi:Competence protein CoiA-like family
MALYASDEDGYIFAADAEPGGSYRCLECSAPVKVRRGRDRTPHFYHLQSAPRCHLYSKSEDHLILQLQLQKALGCETAQIERPFFTVHRIADLLWEKEKIAFEIQCSSLETSEAKTRIIDYGKMGYQVVWLLDDRIFNRRSVRAAEEFLRGQTCYFFSFQRIGSYFYDQMEIIIESKRLKKGFPLKVDITKPCAKPFLEWPVDLPCRIQERISRSDRYFRGDLIYRAIQAAARPAIAWHFERWRTLEIELEKSRRPPSLISKLFKRFIAYPYIRFIEWLIDQVNNDG